MPRAPRVEGLDEKLAQENLRAGERLHDESDTTGAVDERRQVASEDGDAVQDLAVSHHMARPHRVDAAFDEAKDRGRP